MTFLLASFPDSGMKKVAQIKFKVYSDKEKLKTDPTVDSS